MKTKNKKGQSIFDIFIFIAIVFLIIIFAVIIKYAFGSISSSLISIETPPNDLGINISNISIDTIGNVNAGMGVLDLIGYCIIFGMILTIIIANFLVKSHPIYFVAFIGISIIAVICAIVLSNAYSDLLQDSFMGEQLSSNSIGNFIMLNLPIWITVIGFIGALFLFLGISRDEDIGGGLG